MQRSCFIVIRRLIKDRRAHRYLCRVGDITIHIIERGTARERTVANGSDGVGNIDVGQAGAVPKRIVSDFSDGVGDDDAGQAAAITVFATYCMSVGFD